MNDDRAERAQALIHRCAGIEEAGLPDMARESRYVAGALLETLDQLDAERSARTALQARAETLQKIVGKAAYEACS